MTRYAETSALSKETAEEVAKFIICQLLLQHGAPEVLFTDRDTAFTAALMQGVLRYGKTIHRRTSVHLPQTNELMMMDAFLWRKAN